MYQDLMSQKVFCTVRNDRQAAEIVRLLLGARFTYDEISVYLPEADVEQACRAEIQDCLRPMPRNLEHEFLSAGMPEFESNHLATRVAAGEILVAIETDSDSDVDRVCESFEEAAAESIVILPRLKEAAASSLPALTDLFGGVAPQFS